MSKICHSRQLFDKILSTHKYSGRLKKHKKVAPGWKDVCQQNGASFRVQILLTEALVSPLGTNNFSSSKTDCSAQSLACVCGRSKLSTFMWLFTNKFDMSCQAGNFFRFESTHSELDAWDQYGLMHRHNMTQSYTKLSKFLFVKVQTQNYRSFRIFCGVSGFSLNFRVPSIALRLQEQTFYKAQKCRTHLLCVCALKEKKLEILLCPDLAEGICSPQVNENRLRVAAKDKRNDGHPGHEIIFAFRPIFDVVKTSGTESNSF